MAYDIIIGRSEADRKRFGEKGAVYIGKHYVKMGRTTSLSSKVLLDVVRSHVVLVSGKRGSGKSFSLGVIAEGMSQLPQDIAQNLGVLILDTMGIFWTSKYPNIPDEDLLKAWDLEPGEVPIRLFTPQGFFAQQKEEGIPVDAPFAIQPGELTAEDWALTFGLSPSDPVAVLIEKILYQLHEEGHRDYSLNEILHLIEHDPETEPWVKNSAKNRFRAAQAWGIFSQKATPLSQLVQRGVITVLDVSMYGAMGGGGNVKALVIGLIAKKLFTHRMLARKHEEKERIEKGYSYLAPTESALQDPMVWLFLDEAHEFLPDEGKTAATDPLVTILREGRQPGLSLILATQQPGKIHRDVMTQADIVLSHRLTAKPDIEALNLMMQSYLTTDLATALNNLPREPGAAILLDDNSERIYPLRVRPRFTWHGGEAPTAIKTQPHLDLGDEFLPKPSDESG